MTDLAAFAKGERHAAAQCAICNLDSEVRGEIRAARETECVTWQTIGRWLTTHHGLAYASSYVPTLLKRHYDNSTGLHCD